MIYERTGFFTNNLRTYGVASNDRILYRVFPNYLIKFGAFLKDLSIHGLLLNDLIMLSVFSNAQNDLILYKASKIDLVI